VNSCAPQGLAVLLPLDIAFCGCHCLFLFFIYNRHGDILPHLVDPFTNMIAIGNSCFGLSISVKTKSSPKLLSQISRNW
jgi:hypothetical protein